MNQINEQQKKLSYYKLPEENKSNNENNQRVYPYQKRIYEEKVNKNILNNIKEKGPNDNVKKNTYEKRIIKSSNNYLNKNGKNIDYNDIEAVLKLFIINSNIKYSVDYYKNKNRKDPYTWKLTTIGPKNTVFERKNFDFKLEFKKSYNKFYNNIELETDDYQLNQEIKNLLKDRKYNEKKSVYENVTELLDNIYNLFNEPNPKLQKIFSNKRNYNRSNYYFNRFKKNI